MSARRSLLGDPSIRDIRRVATVKGDVRYASDLNLPRMLHARWKTSPYPHARILSVDTSRAERLPGVKAVLTGKDIIKFPRVTGPRLPDRWIIAYDKVRYWGEEVAAVAATSEEIAAEAVDLIKVEYEPLPFVLDVEEALKPGAPLVHDEIPGNRGAGTRIVRGDPEAGFARADVVVEGKFRFSEGPVQHAEMEPAAAVARWDFNKLTVWEASQWTSSTRDGLASWFNIPRDWVRVILGASPGIGFAGGAFGNKGGPVQTNMAGALFAKMTGRPVKFWNTRAEQFTNTNQKYDVITFAKVGATRDGKLVSMDVHMLTEKGAYGGAGADGPLISFRDAYICANGLFRGTDVYTNKPSAGAYRDVGGAQGTHAAEQIMDMLAEKLGMDPVEFRLLNMMTKAHSKSQDNLRPAETGGGTFGTIRVGTPITSVPQPEATLEALKAFGWKEKWRGWARPTTTNGSKVRGVGVAIYSTDKSKIGGVVNARTEIDQNGDIKIFADHADIGCGQPTAIQIIAAEVFGVKFGDVLTTISDTDQVPDGIIVAGSMGTRTNGLGVFNSAVRARDQLFKIAADILKAKPEDLETADKVVFVKNDPSKKVSFKEIVAKAGKPISALGSMRIPADTVFPQGFVCRGFGTALAEVEVDTDTGIVHVLSYVLAIGIGRVVFRRGADNQFEGGVWNSAGYALGRGGGIWDPLKGNMLNPNFHDFRQPTILDAFPTMDLKAVWVEQGDPIGPFGAIGIGEPVQIAPQAAIANAVYNAIGVRIPTGPITPDKVLTALRAKRGAA